MALERPALVVSALVMTTLFQGKQASRTRIGKATRLRFGKPTTAVLDGTATASAATTTRGALNGTACVSSSVLASFRMHNIGSCPPVSASHAEEQRSVDDCSSLPPSRA